MVCKSDIFGGQNKSIEKKQKKLLGLVGCMCVCIEVALCGKAHGIGRPAGPGGGAHLKWVQCPDPAEPAIPHHARWLILAHCVCILQPTLL